MNQNVKNPKGQLVLRTLAMPSDTNPHGHIFGGWILSQMDLGGGILAKEIARGRVVTVNVSSVTFHLPAMVGDVVCCYARCLKTGTSSITIAIEVWVKRVSDNHNNFGQRECITEATYTYVLVDKHNKPRPLPEPFQQYNEDKDDVSKLGLSKD